MNREGSPKLSTAPAEFVQTRMFGEPKVDTHPGEFDPEGLVQKPLITEEGKEVNPSLNTKGTPMYTPEEIEDLFKDDEETPSIRKKDWTKGTPWGK